MTYKKIKTKFERQYGKRLNSLSKELNVSIPTLSKWNREGFDIYNKAKQLNAFKGNIRLHRLWQNLKSRCGNPLDKKYKYYGGKGIKIRLTKDEIAYMWNRDKAYLMKQPSLDRKNSDKDYKLKNCRFIEMETNRKFMKIKLRKLRCGKCGKKWIPRKLDVRQCPKCKTAYWDIRQ